MKCEVTWNSDGCFMFKIDKHLNKRIQKLFLTSQFFFENSKGSNFLTIRVSGGGFTLQNVFDITVWWGRILPTKFLFIDNSKMIENGISKPREIDFSRPN